MTGIVLGTSEFTVQMTKALLEKGVEVLALISMPAEKQPVGSLNLADFACDNQMTYLEVEDINGEESLNFMKGLEPDVIFSSWPKILGKDVLDIAKRCCVGSHPTELPLNRGRHPLHWMIALGMEKSKFTFFEMDQGVDTGDILLQVPFTIDQDETIDQLILKVNRLAYEVTKELVDILMKGDLITKIKQDHAQANYWRKRNSRDVVLDVRMSRKMIINTVRSFTSPFSYAKLIVEDSLICIIDARAMEQPVDCLHLEHGKIINVETFKIQIKVEDGIVELTSLEPLPDLLREQHYVYSPIEYLLRYPKKLSKELLSENQSAENTIVYKEK